MLNSPYQAQPSQLDPGLNQQKEANGSLPIQDKMGLSDPSRSPASQWADDLQKNPPSAWAQSLMKNPPPKNPAEDAIQSENPADMLNPILNSHASAVNKMAGAMAGGEMGEALGGPLGGMLGGALGFSGAGAITDKLKDLWDKANGLPNLEDRHALRTALTDFGSALLGEGMFRAVASPIISEVGTSAAMKKIADASTDVAVLKAQEILKTQKEIEQATGVRIPVRQDQLFQNSNDAAQAAQNLYSRNPEAFSTAQESQKSQFIKAWSQIKEGIEGKVSSEMKSSFKNYTDQVVNGYENDIHHLALKGQELAKDRQFPDETSGVLSSMQKVLSNNGVKFGENGAISDVKNAGEGIGPLIQKYLNLYGENKDISSAFSAQGGFSQMPSPYEGVPIQEQTQSFKGLPPNPSGSVQRGMSLKDIEDLRFQAKDKGAFDNFDPTDSQKAWRQVYSQVADARDSVLSKVFQDTGDLESLKNLQASRNAYTKEVDNLKMIKMAIQHDPSNAARYLIDPQDPESVKKVWAVIGDDGRKLMKSQYLDHLAEGNLKDGDEFSQTSTLNASQIYKKWDSIDPKVKNILYSGDEQKMISKLMNLGRAIETKQFPSFGAIENDSTVKEAAALVKVAMGKYESTPFRFFTGIFKENPKVMDFMDAKMMQGRDLIKDPSQISTSNWTRAAHILKDYNTPIRATGDLGASAAMNALLSPKNSSKKNELPGGETLGETGQNQ